MEKPTVDMDGVREHFSQNRVQTDTMQILVDLTEYKQLQEELLRYREHLETLVAERTAELQKVNAQLRREIAAYKQIGRISCQEGLKLHEALQLLEKRLVSRALEQYHWHRGKTATSLGIPRRSLQRKMNKYGLM